MKSEDLHIAEPCHENWEAMEDRGARRFCDSCVKEVHDLSMLTAEEAQDLLVGREDVCIRYLSDERGDVLFRDESSPTWRLHRQKEGARQLMAAASIALMAAACEPTDVPPPQPAPNAITIEPGSPARLNLGAPRTPEIKQASRIEIPGWLIAYLSTPSAKAHTKLTVYLAATAPGPEYHGTLATDVHVKLGSDDATWLRGYLEGLSPERRPTLLLDETVKVVPAMHDPTPHIRMGQAIAPIDTGAALRPHIKPTIKPTPVAEPVVKPKPPKLRPKMGKRIHPRHLREVKGRISSHQKHLDW